MDRPAEHLVWIYLGLMARADAVSQIPLRLSDAGDRIIDSGRLADLLASPNAMQDTVAYLATIEQWLALYNECVVAIVPDPRGGVLELIPLNPRWCKPVTAVHVPTGTRMVAGYEYADPSIGERVAFTRAEVIVMMRPGPYDATRALWPEIPGRRSLQTDILAQEQNLAIFKNGGMPDIVFETEQQWTKEQSDEFLERWQDRYGGVANAHKPGILYGGLKSKGLGLSPADLQFFEGRRMSRSEQIALIRVKPAMVILMEGETGLSQGSSTVEQYASWWRSVGLGELALISAAHQRDLVSKFDWGTSAAGREMTREELRAGREHKARQARHGVRSPMVAGKLSLWFDENEIEELAEERFKRVEAFSKLLGAGYRPDDMSDYLRLRLPPHTDNVGRVPFNLQPVSDSDATGQGREAHVKRSTRSSAPSDRVDDLLAGLDATLSRMGRESVAAERDGGAEVPARWKGLRAVLDRFVAEREKAAARKWSRHFSEQRARVLDRFDELAGTSTERETRAVTLDEAGNEEASILARIFPRGDEDMNLKALIGPLVTRQLEDGFGFFAGQDAPGVPVPGFDTADPRVMEAIDRRVIQASKVNATTESDLREIIRAGFAEGDTTAQLGMRIADYYRDQVGEDKARPMTAAATQTTGIVNDGRMIAARSVGGLRKGWLHGGSREPRPAHLEAQARYQAAPIGLEEKFTINGFAADAPGDASLPIGEVANCTCMVTFHRAEGE
jgi:HK97 family phage portal protein